MKHLLSLIFSLYTSRNNSCSRYFLLLCNALTRISFENSADPFNCREVGAENGTPVSVIQFISIYVVAIQ